jgi:fructose-bisphosphate aldolase, class II
MKSLRETIAEFRASGRALGHFNISDSNQLKALADAAMETKIPVLVGLSEGEREHFPLEAVRLLVDMYNRRGALLFLNADHTYSIEKAQRAISAGVDSIVIDGAKLTPEENISMTSACVKYARGSGRDVLVEGELGYIGQSSQVIDTIPEGAAITEDMMTKADEAKSFIEATGIDLLAPAVGNIHGMIASGMQPALSIARIGKLAEGLSIPLVLHGGSGSPDEEFSSAVEAGISIIHINTELRLSYRRGLERALHEMTHEAAPYKWLAPAVSDMRELIAQKARLFSGK